MSINLNKQQREVAEHLNGPCLVTACPGSGKTTTLTERIVRLVEKGVAPKKILCLTFTNKAANEMKERIYERLPEVCNSGLFLGTFHSFCVRVLRKFGSPVGYNSSFSILDTNDQAELIIQIMRRFDTTPKKSGINPKWIISEINTGRELCENFSQLSGRFQNNDLAWQVAKTYLEQMKQHNLIDFSGLLYETFLLLKNNPFIDKANNNILEFLHERKPYIQVDEAQDSNYIQFQIINLLGGNRSNVVITGDLDQSIYRFRGARYQNITDFLDQHKNCIELQLPLNYRSTPEIVQSADNLIKKNSSHKIDGFTTNNASGAPVRALSFDTTFNESNWVANRITQFINEEGWDPSDIAVLYRVNALSRSLETSLASRGIKYLVLGGRSFYDRREVRDCISLLRFASNNSDNVAFSRCANLLKGVGKTTVGEIEKFSHEKNVDILSVCKEIRDYTTKSSVIKAADKIKDIFDHQGLISGPSKLMEHLISAVDYDILLNSYCKTPEEVETRKSNVEELIIGASQFEKQSNNNIAQYLQNISLITSSDKSATNESVSLMTIHAAKGLEFPIVFIVGVQEGNMPHYMATAEAGGDPEKLAESIEEERRICYVAMTRAKDHLLMSYANNVIQRKWGKNVTTNAHSSRFLSEAKLIKRRL